MGKDALIRPATGYSGLVRNICHLPGGARLKRAFLDPHCAPSSAGERMRTMQALR